MQILVALELLSILPIPSYLTSRSAHHRRLHSSSSTSHSQNWLAILRNGTPQRGSSTNRKRKKDFSIPAEKTYPSGPITSSNLTTPRQSSNLAQASIYPNNIDSIAEDEILDDLTIQRQKLERLFKDTARLLDAQTDNLAIQQTVASAIGGLSLADLMGETPSSSSSGLGLANDGNGNDGKGKGKEELDVFQAFWLEVVEEQ